MGTAESIWAGGHSCCSRVIFRLRPSQIDDVIFEKGKGIEEY